MARSPGGRQAGIGLPAVGLVRLGSGASEIIGGLIAENSAGPGGSLLPLIAFVGGGIAMQDLMVGRADRRNDAVAEATLSMVPPPPLPLPPRYDHVSWRRADHGRQEAEAVSIRSGAGGVVAQSQPGGARGHRLG